MAALSETGARVRHARGKWHGLPLGFVVGRYFVYVIVGLLAIALWAQLSLKGMLESGEVYPAEYGSEHVVEVMDQALDQGSFDPDAIPSAYWYLLVDEDGRELATDLGDRGSVLYSVAESLKGSETGPAWHVEELPRYYDIWGSNVHHWRYRRLEDGSWLLLAYQNLPQYATRELRDSRPNVLVQLGWTCAGAGAALIVGVGAWAAHVISRKLRPAMGAAERIEAADLDSPVGTSNVRQVNDLLTAMERIRSALRETLDARWRAEEAQREAVASLAHELKTPLTVLSANAELLATGAAEGPDAEAAARAVADAARRLDECASRIMSATLT